MVENIEKISKHYVYFLCKLHLLYFYALYAYSNNILCLFHDFQDNIWPCRLQNLNKDFR